MIKVSIVVPIYGVESYIGKCAESLFSQTYTNIEFLFVNDATKDNSIKILESVLDKFPQRKSQVKILIHEINKGLSGARNTGVLNFTGDYLLHVDGDDFLELTAVEELVNFIQTQPADIIIFDYYSVTKVGKKYMHSSLSTKDEMIKKVLLKKFAPSIWNKMYSAKLYRSNFDTLSIEGINHGEDYATTPRLLFYASSIAKLDKALYNYVQYNAGSYSNNLSLKSIQSMITADSVLYNFFKNNHIAGVPFPQIMNSAKLRTKVALLKRCDISFYSYISELYNDISLDDNELLSLSDRILLSLSKLKMFRLAFFYSHLGLKIKKMMRK